MQLTRRSAFKSLVAGVALGGLPVSPLDMANADAMAGMNKKAKEPAKPDVVFHGRGFEPMTSKVIVGDTLEIISAAKNALQLTSAPSAPGKIQRAVAPGAKVSLRFDKPGLFLLYDGATTRFDAKVGQVVAKQGTPQFPLPAYTIVLVIDHNGRGPAHTKPLVTIPDSSMTFEPWAIVVNAGEPISFVNNDGDAHIAMPSPEPMLMAAPSGGGKLSSALWLETMESFAPIMLAGNGGKGTLTLSQPGLHHYYCPIHTAYDATAYTFAPLKSYGGYPFIMDGVIVVLPV